MDPKHIVTRTNTKTGEVRTYVKIAGLLDAAHDEGLTHLDTDLVQIPCEENHLVAIAKCTVRTKRGTFTGWGDASPANVDSFLIPSIIRMAETRAIARALRWATNQADTALEELGPEACGNGNGHAGPAPQPPDATPTPTPKDAAPQAAHQNGPPITPNQLNAINAIARDRNISAAALDAYAQSNYGRHLSAISKPDASLMIDDLKAGSLG